MKDKIIQMLNEGREFIDIFRELKCTDEEFLEALREQQEDSSFHRLVKNVDSIIAV